MTDNKLFSTAMPAIALCLAMGPVLYAVAETEVARSSDHWGGHASVGPAGCDYADLQSAIDAGAAGNHGGHIGVHTDYEITGEYVMDDFTNWQDNPWIVGGFASCNIGDLDAASSRTFLNANDQNRHFRIEYDAEEEDPLRIVTLQNFNLLNGLAGNAGSTLVAGAPGRLSVHFVNSLLSGNSTSAGGGGAVEVRATADTIVEDPGFPPPPVPAQIPPMLLLNDETTISNNSAAQFGGGINCTGESHAILGSMINTGNALIQQNHANFAGGGINAHNCHFTVPSGQANFAGGIILNTSDDRGGAIAASGGSHGLVTGKTSDAFGRPIGGDPEHAALLAGNQANRGGAIFAEGSATQIRLEEAVLSSNQALSDNGSPGLGGGIHVTGQATVEFSQRPDAGPCQQPEALAFPPCNRIMGNSVDGDGGAAYVHNGGHLIINDAYISDNTAESGEIVYSINTADPGTVPAPTVEIENSLMTGNGNEATPGQSLILGDWDSEIEIRWSTMAGNFDADSPGAKVTMDGAILAETSLTIIGSILWSNNEEVSLVDKGADTIDEAAADCMIGHRLDTETGIASSELQFYSQIDPEFLNPDAGNYRLSLTSPAIDYCNGQSVPERDLDGRERDVAFGGDITEAPNAHPDGIHDIGAFTVQEPVIFQDRFEAN